MVLSVFLFNVSPILKLPFPSLDKANETNGGLPSSAIALLSPKEPAEPGSGKVNVAIFPTASTIDPPFRASADELTKSRSADVWPFATIY